ncbi:MAG: ATP phosphoribosyltransferase [Trueperaceae bacterium]|nr:ATP phosphoribosyltransferase [Trueperaceae bacterium]
MPEAAQRPLVAALPKGRVLSDALAALRAAGLELALGDASRLLRHEAPGGTVLLMRNADVPTYVDLGVADLGVVGKDVLLESGSAVYEPVDLGFAACRMSLIRPVGARGTVRRIASKYPRVTASYLARVGSSAEVVALKGNVELACLTGLADAVVDIVQTGSTLEANDLEEVDVLLRSSARLVVNRAALKLRADELKPLIRRLRAAADTAAG